MYYIAGFLFVFSSLAYVAYKKFREPMYKPGNVALQSEQEGFDDANLHSKSTDKAWLMPNGVEMHK